MSRLDYVTIAIVVICLVALGFLVYKTVGLMTTDTSDENQISNIQEGDESGQSDDTYQYGDSYADDTSSYATQGDQDLDDDELGYTGDGNYAEDETTQPGASTTDSEIAEEPLDDSPVSDTRSQAEEYSRSGSSQGEYLVLAGSFRVLSNAEDQVSRLRSLGYLDAEVARFNQGTYAGALVNRFDSYADAKALVNELNTKHGIEAIVQRQRGN